MALELIDNLITFIDTQTFTNTTGSQFRFNKARAGDLYISNNGMTIGNNNQNMYGNAMFGTSYLSKSTGDIFKCKIQVNECSNYCGIGFTTPTFKDFKPTDYNKGENGCCIFYNDSCFRTSSEFKSSLKPGHDASEFKFNTNDTIICTINMNQQIATLTNENSNKGIKINIISEQCALIFHFGEGGHKLFTVSDVAYRSGNLYDHLVESELEQLSKMTIIVADTGDFEAIKKYKPRDSTTNPSLVYKALNAMKSDDEKMNVEYNNLLSKAIKYTNEKTKNMKMTLEEKLCIAIDRLSVEFGLKILSVIPGYVSTELDARLSYDIDKSVQRAVGIIKMYQELGVQNAKDRVLIKVATTWEGIQIAKILKEEHGIKCNMTLLFSIWQAAAASQIADAYLISPFVGRITDWHKKNNNIDSYDAYVDDPGVISVKNIFGYYKRVKSNTIVMGASFRNKDQILALCGCDRLTIAPKWLQLMKDSNNKIDIQLVDKGNKTETIYKEKLDINISSYRFGMCEDACATEKLAEGIRKFAKDIENVENILKDKFLETS